MRPPTLHSRSDRRRFWQLQALGWSAFAVAMSFSRVGVFPLPFMIANKGVLATLGLLSSLVLWRVYRSLARRNVSFTTIVVASVLCSYVMAAVWSIAANLLDIPLYAWLLDREVRINSPVRLLAGSVYHSFALFAWSLCYFAIKHNDALQAERERSLAAQALANQAQLDALRYQLNPHLLFNTLNGISTLVVEGRNDEASQMIARLSAFLRLSLAGPAKEHITLTEEIDYARQYLDIEQTRFGDRLRVEIHVGDDAWRGLVPHLILQPLVENAVRYAVAPRTQGGTITIYAARDNGSLRLSVSDDGPGLASVGTSSESNGAARIGLANTRDRLRILYPDAHEFTVNDTAAPGHGVRVSITLPFREDSSGT